MIVEQRTYTLHPGNIPSFMALYQNEGLPIQRQYLKRMLGYYMSEIGELNQLIHLWGYNSFEERLEVRQLMRDDPAFQVYWQKVQPLIQHQKTCILLPAPVFRQRLDTFVEVIDASQS
ncbi:hypothetical protein PS943_04364 [Pseudomonas fluorescens]|uniref:NIPSNAP domain-containing protein n=1 Tax=Pseudomonas fluorescens TaxID=294 RepID=A0A5E7WMF5_PSEFL|nr:NIPSNAP family protein [Pseudomonas fluorescens]VVQ35475.1 hypothetical protein PS943_04364 [Pseudomonas fluorescens]